VPSREVFCPNRGREKITLEKKDDIVDLYQANGKIPAPSHVSEKEMPTMAHPGKKEWRADIR